jgi:hypothetical protein
MFEMVNKPDQNINNAHQGGPITDTLCLKVMFEMVNKPAQNMSDAHQGGL